MFWTLPSLARFPAFQKPISRRATLRFLKKMKNEREKHGKDFAILERYRRKGMPFYEAAPEPHPPQFLPLLAGKGEIAPIVPGSLTESLKNVKLGQETDKKIEKINIRHRQEQKSTESKGPKDLSLDKSKIPKVINVKEAFPEGLKPVQQSTEVHIEGPAYAYGIQPSEMDFIINKAIKAIKAMNPNSDETTLEEQAEMLRRLVSLENASKEEIQHFNRHRLLAMSRSHVTNTGAPEVQILLLTNQLVNIKEHLAKNRKDANSKQQADIVASKRLKMLKYLRRKNLEKFVEICKVVGIEPDTIRA